jgi:hypothetical protein
VAGEALMAIDPYRSVNRDYWDREAALNLESWDIDGFLGDPARLTRMVTADRPALGEVKGKRLIHLQCHFGLDTIAWARLGAVATGADFAPRAIAATRDPGRALGDPSAGTTAPARARRAPPRTRGTQRRMPVLALSLQAQLGELDLPLDLLGQLHAADLQRDLGLQGLVAFEPALVERVADRLLDLALRGDADDLQELPRLHVEPVFVHPYSLLRYVRRLPSACPAATAHAAVDSLAGSVRLRHSGMIRKSWGSGV